MAAHRKSRKRMPLAIVLFLLLAAAGGGYALAGNRTQETVNLASASGASSRDVTVSACLASGKLTRVSLAAAPKCPAKSARVHWAGQSGPASPPSPATSASSSPSTTSPNPDPTTTSPSPVQTTTTTSPPPSGFSCVTSAPSGNCGPYSDPQITMSNGFDTYVANNCWGDPSCRQTVSANDPGHWQVSADEPAGNTAVMTYPDVKQLTNDWCGTGWAANGGPACNNPTDTPLSSLSLLTSTFTESMLHDPVTIAEAGYDIWTNYSSDIMIWVDNVNRGAGGAQLLASNQVIGGQSFDVYQYGGQGGEIIFSLNGSGGSGTFAQETSGTVDILATLRWVQSHGYASNISIGEIDFGWEICSTGGAPETFSVSSYSLDSTPSS
jgi:hypothetical protein